MLLPPLLRPRVEVLALAARADKAIEVVGAVLVFWIPLRAVRKSGGLPGLASGAPVKLVPLPSLLIA